MFNTALLSTILLIYLLVGVMVGSHLRQPISLVPKRVKKYETGVRVATGFPFESGEDLPSFLPGVKEPDMVESLLLADEESRKETKRQEFLEEMRSNNWEEKDYEPWL